MKKLLILALSLASSTNLLFALPIGNPALPRYLEEGIASNSAAWVNLRVGYEGDFVHDVRLLQKQEDSERIDSFEKNMQGGSVTLSVRNRLDLFGVAGQVRYCADWEVKDSGITSKIAMRSRYGYGWAAGTRIIFLEWGNATISAGGRYQSARVKLSSISRNSIPYEVKGARVKQREWQVDFGLSYKLKLFVPYIEGFYSKPSFFVGKVPSLVLADNGDSKLKMKKRNLLGLGLGCGLTASKACLLNFEARLFNEEAFTVSADIRF